ncbi:MAG: galactose-1-phosphate uridylyltransferase [Rhodothermales bacterium]|nr:galactose-1-phosphate uridylyltransferase [Rhodothermales bacterium]
MIYSGGDPEHGNWEQRWHPLRQEWVIMAAHRQNRPWSGVVHEGTEHSEVEHDPDCYLCPRNDRVHSRVNSDYRGVYVFDNDHPCVSMHAPGTLEKPTGIYQNRPASGVARVICFSEKHNMTLARLPSPGMLDVLHAWQSEYTELGSKPDLDHVLIFENNGEVVGVSNPHPHGQIYATNFVFNTIDIEARAAADHLKKTGSILFQDIISAELNDETRVIDENDHAIAFIPYFARYAYEVYVAPRKTYSSIADVPDDELIAFGQILRSVLVRFDNLWKIKFPYVMVHHNAPTDGRTYDGFHYHIQFHPPLRKPGLIKHLAGPEIGGGNFLSDTNPDEKAAELRNVSSTHYLDAD